MPQSPMTRSRQCHPLHFTNDKPAEPQEPRQQGSKAEAAGRCEVYNTMQKWVLLRLGSDEDLAKSSMA